MPPLVFLDTETTGLGDCRLVELSLAILPTFTGNPSVETYRCKPPIPIETHAMAVHHITEEDVAELPPFQSLEEYPRILDAIETGLVVAHNAKFDIGVLAREGIRVGPHIDTQALARALHPEAKSHALQFLRYYLGVRMPGIAHTSDGDVRVLFGVFGALARTVGQKHELDDDRLVVEEMRRITVQMA